MTSWKSTSIKRHTIEKGGEGMKRRKTQRVLRVNGDTMTRIVVGSLLFCVAVVIAGLVLAYRGQDCAAIVDSALRVFGTELGICGVMTIFKRWTETQDRRMEARRLEREKRRNENG